MLPCRYHAGRMEPVVMAPLVGALLALVCIAAALRAGRRQRLIDNLPTSKTSGVFIGLVELKGTAEAERPLHSFLAELPCVHYEWSVAEHWSRTVTETYTDKDGKTRTRTRRESGWTTVANGGEQIPFYLRDDAGVVRVQPARAKLHTRTVFSQTCGRNDPLYYAKGPRRAIMNSDHRRRFAEEAIPLHAPIYVVGTARERSDIVAPEIRHDRDAPLFLISTRTEESVRGSYRLTYWLLTFLAVLLGTGGWIAADVLRDRAPAGRVPVYVAAGLGVLLVALLAWLWMAYNSMVDLRQRVRQGWANIDVQLKRRADLIPNLVAIVRGLRDHEQKLQTELAEFRSQLAATAPGAPGPDPHGCAALLRLTVERYPELRADDAFLRLQQELVATEQRIALARAYFNHIATFYNNRLETLPDRYVAALAGLQPQPLLAATDFERAPVTVRLVE